jgi:hypothetical protein
VQVRDPDLEIHPKVEDFALEGANLNKKEMHALILEEITQYHPKERARFEKSGILKPKVYKKTQKKCKQKAIAINNY